MNTSVLLRKPISKAFSQEDSMIVNGFLPTTLSPSIKKRARLWELDEMYHCSVIGTCLSVSDLTRLARLFNFRASLDDKCAMHVEAVGHVNTCNEISEAIHRFLDKKHQIYITYFELARNDTDVLALWKKYCISGGVAGALWAVLTHKAANREIREIVHANAYMLSHQLDSDRAADMRRLARLEKENTEIRSTIKHQQQQQARSEIRLRKQLQATVSELERLRQSGSEVAALQARVAEFESGVAMIEMGQRLMSLTTANEQLKIEAERANKTS
ncbi:hypothetical protein [Nitrosomonas cryotolerans]|nr:hypothetical protein [Nitrosomonas cryotolerans]